MKIQGQVKSSFIDYPGKICTVLFVGGCNFRCGYCHNTELVRNKGNVILEEDIFTFLNKRKKYLDAVCISGGEPTLYNDLYDFIKKIKNNQYLIKLDTNGSNPEVLIKLLSEKIIDYIAMDIKAPLNRYHEITDVNVNVEKIEKSISIIQNSDIEYEFRTTICKEMINERDLLDIVKLIRNAKRFCIQNVKKTGPLLNDEITYTPFSQDELDKIKQKLEKYVQELIIRN